MIRKRLASIAFIALAMVLLISGVVLASTILQSFQVNWNVVTPASIYGISLFSDYACTIPFVPPVSFSSIEQGSSASFTVYAKNTGNQSILLTASSSNPVMTVNPSTAVSLGLGSSAGWIITVTIPSNEPLGTGSGTISFSSP